MISPLTHTDPCLPSSLHWAALRPHIKSPRCLPHSSVFVSFSCPAPPSCLPYDELACSFCGSHGACASRALPEHIAQAASCRGAQVSGAAEDYCRRASASAQAWAGVNCDLDSNSDGELDGYFGRAPVVHKPSGDYSHAWLSYGGEGDVPAHAHAQPVGGEGSARVPPPVGFLQQAQRAEQAVDAVVLPIPPPFVRVHHGAQPVQCLLLRVQCVPLLPDGRARTPAAAQQRRLPLGVALRLHARATDILLTRPQHPVTSHLDISFCTNCLPDGCGFDSWSGDGAGMSAEWSAGIEASEGRDPLQNG